MTTISSSSAKAALRSALRHVPGAEAAGRKVLQKVHYRVPCSEQPLVSIIIPVYGHWKETFACLKAVAATAGNIPYEIIVVDDCSPDSTGKKLDRIFGLRVIHMPKNGGFIRACNTGLQHARGEIVVYLNNDTEVSPTWLIPIVERMEDPSIGLVGARLVYADGTLQEAGGVVFADGVTENYGNGNNPENHSYTYFRDVDYCSGACLAVRKSILDELGGFDERYIPAYYEDTDLAFEVRRLGYRTVYEPRSLVIHHEGVSNGTDTSQGTKRYQVINKAKFAQKWAKELASQPLSRYQDPDFEMERAVHTKNVVIVCDGAVITPDLDSGSVRMEQILLELLRLGYQPIFIPQNKERPEPYVENLTKRGIQVVYDSFNEHGQTNISAYALTILLRGNVRGVILSRVGVAAAAIFPVTHALPGVPVIFDTVDLHGTRELREAKLAGDDALITAAHQTKELELGVMRASTATLVVSSEEAKMLHAVHPELPVFVVGNVHVPVEHPAGLQGRRSISFIGSFAHPPNADGLHWYFTEVHPLVREELGDVEVNVYGKNPPESLRVFEGNDVKLCGYAADLADVYNPARLSIAPLRYGAGVKGKVGESLSWGVPIVTTDIGAEGMGLEDRETALIANSPEDFARAIVDGMRDDALWERLSTAGERHIQEIMGVPRLHHDLAAAFDFAGITRV